jgi:hypothetical protein
VQVSYYFDKEEYSDPAAFSDLDVNLLNPTPENIQSKTPNP